MEVSSQIIVKRLSNESQGDSLSAEMHYKIIKEMSSHGRKKTLNGNLDPRKERALEMVNMC